MPLPLLSFVDLGQVRHYPTHRMGTCPLSLPAGSGLNVGKCWEPNSLVSAMRCTFHHCLLSRCGPCCILSVRVRSAPAPGEPRGSLSLSLSLVCFRILWNSFPAREDRSVCRSVACPLPSAAGTRAEGVRPWELCLHSQWQKSKPGQAKPCLFQTLLS